MTNINASIAEHFSSLEDPRTEHLNDHGLIEIIIIAICAVVCGAEGWTDVELFGKERYDWLKQFLDLENGIPSHDTFGRVFSRINGQQFHTCFVSWIQAVFQTTKGQVVAIDGKTVRRSHDRTIGKNSIHVVSPGLRPIIWCWANKK